MRSRLTKVLKSVGTNRHLSESSPKRLTRTTGSLPAAVKLGSFLDDKFIQKKDEFPDAAEQVQNESTTLGSVRNDLDKQPCRLSTRPQLL
jgi:hypothetical protein